MKVLIVNKFLHHVGGVETYVQWLARHLPKYGHEVAFFGMTPPYGKEVIPEANVKAWLTPNREFNGTFRDAVNAGASSVYSVAAAQRLTQCLDEFDPDIIHFHSTCRQLTSSLASVVIKRQLPSITTVHEYRPVCASQRLWDDSKNKPCYACLNEPVGRRMLNIVSKQCVRGSMLASMAAAVELPIADALWARSRTILHAPSRYMAARLQEAGQITNSVYFLDLPWGKAPEIIESKTDRSEFTYIGRLSREKGIGTLLNAWRMIESTHPHVNLRIAGSGKEEPGLKSLTRDLNLQRVSFTGAYHPKDLGDILKRSIATVHPSVWAENSPFSVRESLMHGVPAIVTNCGGMPDMVGAESGTVVPPDDARALSAAMTAEYEEKRAASATLLDAVGQRRISDENHMEGLHQIYDLSKARFRQ